MERKVFLDHRAGWLNDVDPFVLDSPEEITRRSLLVARDVGFNVVSHHLHRFEPIGISLVLVVSQSHFAVHTWPEHYKLHVDALSCSPEVDMSSMAASLKRHFSPGLINLKKFDY